jgi:CRP/FNR family transcriptional regulator, cyclic AMP receptor protein
MSTQELARRLRRVDILEPLSTEELEKLSFRIPEVRSKEGELFYTPSLITGVLFLLLEGRLRIYKMVGGRELTLEVLQSGTMFGEAALVGEPEGTYAEILELSRIAYLRTELLREIVRNNPEVGIRVAELLTARMRLYADKMVDIALKEVPARLAHLFLWLAEIEGTVNPEGYSVPNRYTHELLGTMIGAKRVAVTRAMSKLRKDGLVDAGNESILLKDREALERIAAGSALA